MRLTTNPGPSLTFTGFLPISMERSQTVCTVASEVCRAGMTSTSFITLAGLKKCIPTTLSARLVIAAISVMEREEVLVAIITSGASMASSLVYMSFLTSIFSKTASITKSTFVTSSNLSVPVILASTASLVPGAAFPFSSALDRLLPMALIARSTNSCLISYNTTFLPAAASAQAIPCPMVPAPSIAMVLIVIIIYLPINQFYFCGTKRN